MDILPFRKHPGPLYTPSQPCSAFTYFIKLFPEDLLELLVQETNRYAEQRIAAGKTKAEAWKPTSLDEIKALLGVALWMGVTKEPNVRDYWSENVILGHPGNKEVMPRNRFQQLLSHLHFADNAARPPDCQDKVYKIRPLLTSLQTSFKACWSPHQQMSIDEGMIPYKGRISFRQYMKDKPTKWGYKTCKLVD